MKDSVFHFSPSDISLHDDAFHGSTAARFTEWWYFDVLCDNGYSIQMNVRVLSIIKNRYTVIPQRITLYKDGVLLQQNTKRYSLKNSELFEKYSLVTLEGNQVFKGEVDSNGKWVYDVSFHLNNISAYLLFEGTTKG